MARHVVVGREIVEHAFMSIQEWGSSMDDFELPGLGWRPDLPDVRDFSPDSPRVQTLLAPLRVDHGSRGIGQVDLREYFPMPTHQLSANCSCAHTCISLIEYFQRRSMGQTTTLSRLFLYKASRRLLGLSGNVCTDMRSTLKAIKLFGVPPERYWPYVEETMDDEPDAFLYSFGDPYKSICYVRLDTRASSGKRTLRIVKAFLAAGFPIGFGFPVPSSISSAPDIPFRPRYDSVCGGQAVAAVGYDDNRIVASRGALLIRNSWGSSWGEKGYGWLPYEYVTNLLAADFWTILKPEWLEHAQVRRPVL
jgi:C1A family cysteine protease